MAPPDRSTDPRDRRLAIIELGEGHLGDGYRVIPGPAVFPDNEGACTCSEVLNVFRSEMVLYRIVAHIRRKFARLYFRDFKSSRSERKPAVQLGFFRAKRNTRWYAANVSSSSTQTMDRRRATIGVAGTR